MAESPSTTRYEGLPPPGQRTSGSTDKRTNVTRRGTGTDGFALALLDLGERARLVEAIGPAAESLVHLYGSCDRAAVYPRLDQPAVAFTDRFTGRTAVPEEWLVRGFAEITAANELDVVLHNAELAAEHGPGLHGLMRRARRHLSPAAVARWDELARRPS